jgi:hypothetical protein
MILSISLDLEMRGSFNSVEYNTRIPIIGVNRGPKEEVRMEIVWSALDVIGAAAEPQATAEPPCQNVS